MLLSGVSSFIFDPQPREIIVERRLVPYDLGMELLGRVDHGVIVPQGDANLPEGATVRIVFEPEAAAVAKKPGHRLKLPLVESDKPGSLHLTNEMIAEILDEDDLSP